MADERRITTNSLKALKKAGAFAVKIHAGPNQNIGLPDICGCYKGYGFVIEMKAPGKENTLTDRQREKLEKYANAGGFAYVCTSVAECLNVLKQIDRTIRGKYAPRTGGW